jgi:hypothetical protein
VTDLKTPTDLRAAAQDLRHARDAIAAVGIFLSALAYELAAVVKAEGATVKRRKVRKVRKRKPQQPKPIPSQP